MRLTISLACVLALVALAAPLATTAIGSGSYSPSTFTASRTVVTYRTSGDSFFVNTDEIWNSTKAQGVRNYSAQGYRYTQDIRDYSDNVHATCCAQNVGWRSNFTNPVFDTDDDDGDFKREEAEVTADSTSFPQANGGYYFDARFSHWHSQLCGRSACWYFDPDSGNIGHASQISAKACGICEWNTHLNDGPYLYTSYPYVTPPAGAAAASAAAPSVAVAERSLAGVTAPKGAPFRVADGAERGEVVIRPDLSNGLGAYAEKAWKVSELLTAAGPANGVITFSRPLDGSDLVDLGKAGLKVGAVEALARDRKTGGLVTVGSGFGDGVATGLRELASGRGADLLGIVSAEVTVPDASILAGLRADSRVFLVDLSAEQLRRARPDLIDIVLNDVYWHLANLL